MGVSLPRTAWMCNAADLLAKLAVAGNPEIIRAGSQLGGSEVPSNVDPTESSAKPVSGQLIEVDSSVAAKAFVGIPLSLLWPYSSALVCVRAPRYKNNV
jgi:hypothetical protein